MASYVSLLAVLALAWLAAVAWLHVRFVFAATVVADRGAGPFAALAESWKLTEGRTASLAWLCYDTGLMLFLGFRGGDRLRVRGRPLATLAHVAAYLRCAGEARPQGR